MLTQMDIKVLVMSKVLGAEVQLPLPSSLSAETKLGASPPLMGIWSLTCGLAGRAQA